MHIETIVKILRRKTTDPGDGFTEKDILTAFEAAIIEVEKQVAKAVIVEPWEPNRCPCCNANLGGKCNDGYYRNPQMDKCPECGQHFDIK